MLMNGNFYLFVFFKVPLVAAGFMFAAARKKTQVCLVLMSGINPSVEVVSVRLQPHACFLNFDRKAAVDFCLYLEQKRSPSVGRRNLANIKYSHSFWLHLGLLQNIYIYI